MILNIINLPAIVDLRPNIVLFDNQTNIDLIKLNYSELGLLKSIYKKYKYEIISNTESFWLSDKQYKELKKLGYDDKLDQVGLKINYHDTEIVLYNHILSKINQDNPIVLFEETFAAQSTNMSVLLKVKEKLIAKGYKVFQTRSIVSEIETGNSTANLLLEFATGFKIKNNKFTITDVTQFNEIEYYDNNSNRILYLRRLNEILANRLEISKPDIAHQVREFIDESKLMINLNNVSSNEINPITKLPIKLHVIHRFVKSFENWKFDQNI